MKRFAMLLSVCVVLLFVFSMIVLATDPLIILQRKIIRIEAEDFPNVNGAEKVVFAKKINSAGTNETPFPFGNTLMRFTSETGILSGKVYLTVGNYIVNVYFNGPDSDSDALFVNFNNKEERFWTHGFNNQNGEIPSFEISISKDGLYPVAFIAAEVGCEVDALEFIKK